MQSGAGRRRSDCAFINGASISWGDISQRSGSSGLQDVRKYVLGYLDCWRDNSDHRWRGRASSRLHCGWVVTIMPFTIAALTETGKLVSDAMCGVHDGFSGGSVLSFFRSIGCNLVWSAVETTVIRIIIVLRDFIYRRITFLFCLAICYCCSVPVFARLSRYRIFSKLKFSFHFYRWWSTVSRQSCGCSAWCGEVCFGMSWPVVWSVDSNRQR